MKSLVIYDPIYSNTEKIAKAIGNELNSQIIHVNEVKLHDIKNLELLIVGSPVHGGRAHPNGLKNVMVTAFDTRFDVKEHGLGIKLLLSVIRYAAEKIEKELIKKGGIPMGNPEGFIPAVPQVKTRFLSTIDSRN